VARTAIDKAIRSRSPQALGPGEYTVVLEPMAVGDLMNFLLSSLNARSADEGRSFFSKPDKKTKVGESLIAKPLSLVSDPADPNTPGAAFDEEGVPLGRVPWFEEGTLKALASSRYWAAKTKVPPTGKQGTFLLSGGTAANTDELVGKVKRGLLVTRFWYVRWLQPRELTVTGLTRDGVFLIENGKISRPVNNFRFNQSPLELLARCQAATKTTVRVPSWGGLMRVPAILSERFHMASVSAAV
jgi:predicted Zn-dependent protease